MVEFAAINITFKNKGISKAKCFVTSDYNQQSLVRRNQPIQQMKTSIFLPVIMLSLMLLACKEQENKGQASKSEEVGMPDTKLTTVEIQSDFRKWWTYHSTNIELSSNFIGLNEDLDTISK